MRESKADWSLTEYVWPAVPKLFSETVAALERAEKKLERGGDLHTEEIAGIRDVYHEESLDAQSLKYLVWTKVSLFVGEYSDKAEMAETVISDIRKSVSETSGRVMAVLADTSWASVFFQSSLSYLELYESRKGRADDPWITDDVLFGFIGEDFEKARSAMEEAKLNAGDAIADIQGEMVFVANSWADPERLSKLAIERALLAGKLGNEARPIFDAVKSDFEKLRKRAKKHGYELSFAWD